MGGGGFRLLGGGRFQGLALQEGVQEAAQTVFLPHIAGVPYGDGVPGDPEFPVGVQEAQEEIAALPLRCPGLLLADRLEAVEQPKSGAQVTALQVDALVAVGQVQDIVENVVLRQGKEAVGGGGDAGPAVAGAGGGFLFGDSAGRAAGAE